MFVRKVTSTGLTEAETTRLQRALEGRLKNEEEYSADLTSEVTVLVVNTNDPQKLWLKSKKFKYVVKYRPDVRVLDYEDVCRFCEESHKSIMSLHQLKTFEKLNISLCRIENGLVEKIEKIIEANGGIAKRHLSNDTDIMISMIAEGKRFDAALEWGVSVVSPDWCYDSIDRGLILDTACYKLTKNVTDVIKKLNFENDDDKTGSETMVKTYTMGRRDEACDWNLLKQWRDSEKDRNLEEYIRNKMNNRGKKDVNSDNYLDEYIDNSNDTLLGDGNYDKSKDDIVKLKRKRILDLENKDDSVVKIKRLNKAGELWNSVLYRGKEENQKLNEKKPFNALRREKNGPILQGLKFNTVGFTDFEETKLKKVICKFGGQVLTSFDENVDFRIVSFKYNKPVQGDNLITELAIERFIYNENVDSGDYLWCRPFAINDNIPLRTFVERVIPSGNFHEKSAKLKVSITGFEGTDLSQVERLLKEKLSLWIDFKVIFNQECQLLIVGPYESSGRGRKIQFAKRWNVSIVPVQLFFESVLKLSS